MYTYCYFSPPEIFCVGVSIFPVIWSLLGAYRLWAGEGDLLSAKHVPTMKWDLVLHCLIRRNVPCSPHLRSTWGSENLHLTRKKNGEKRNRKQSKRRNHQAKGKRESALSSIKYYALFCNIYIRGLIFKGNYVKFEKKNRKRKAQMRFRT